ncbi:metalloregulator ArsR/SmtB family transcription factor [Galbibacter sp. PAP.153]|uniref:ArsR/SmtB family transcription factor n=1 Tax=Galbibacter sp. PAP.153 TaxID=3104623 RepID=UPI00300B0B01
MNSDKILFKLHAELCNSMGHPIRLETVHHLKEAELSFSEIAELIGVGKSTLSRHLSIMMNNGVLIQRKEGVNVYYKISSNKITTACALMREILIERLKSNIDIISNVD